MGGVRNTHRLGEIEERPGVHIVGESEWGNEHPTVDLASAKALEVGGVFADVQLGVDPYGLPVVLDKLGESFTALADVHGDGDAFSAGLLEQGLRLFGVVDEEGFILRNVGGGFLRPGQNLRLYDALAPF